MHSSRFRVLFVIFLALSLPFSIVWGMANSESGDVDRRGGDSDSEDSDSEDSDSGDSDRWDSDRGDSDSEDSDSGDSDSGADSEDSDSEDSDSDSDASSTISVDCAAGDSIQAALEDPAQELTIEIRGICRENVVIRRGNVVLRGRDPSVDGIERSGELPLPNPVDVLSTFQVTLENLKLTGGTFGLGVDYSFAVDVVNCRLEGNSFGGLIVVNSNFDLIETTVTGNGRRGAIVNGGSFRCIDCSITDNSSAGSGTGILARQAAQVTLVDTVISGDFRGLDVRAGSEAFVLEASSISSSPDGTGRGFAVDARGAEVNLFETVLSGPLRARSSQVDLTGVTQTIPGAFSQGNVILMGSNLRLTQNTTLAGTLEAHEFSNAVVRGTASVQGDLTCASGADAWCENPAVNVGGASNCGQCSSALVTPE